MTPPELILLEFYVAVTLVLFFIVLGLLCVVILSGSLRRIAGTLLTILLLGPAVVLIARATFHILTI